MVQRAAGRPSLRAPGRLCGARRGARTGVCVGLDHAVLARRLRGQDQRSQCLSLSHGPHRRRRGDRVPVRVPVRAVDHRSSSAAPGQGTADPQRRTPVASGEIRHPHHGRADDPLRCDGLDRAVGQSHQSVCLGRARRHARLRPGRLLRRLLEGHATDPCRNLGSYASPHRSDHCGRRLLCHREPGTTAVRHVAHVSLLQGADRRPRLVFHRVRRVHHRGRRQRGEPHGRSRRACHRSGHDLGAGLRVHRLFRRQRRVFRLSADPFRDRLGRARRAARRRARRRPRLPVVQRAACLDLHGRYRLACARRPPRRGCGRDQA